MHDDDDDLIMLCAAYLAGLGKKQTEIADTLERSQTTVSRLLMRARKDYLREELSFLKEKVDEDTYRLILQRTDRKGLGRRLNQLAERSGHKGPILQVFSSGNKDLDLDKRLSAFSRKAAPYIKDLMVRANSCGITWGTTLWNVVEALTDLALPPPWCGHTISIIPLTGEPLGEMPNGYSSSSLVERLGQLANGNKYPSPSIGMVPAFTPEGFSKAELEGVRKLIQLVKAYGTIFGDGKTPGLADRLDMILTSVGPAEKPLGFGDGTLLKTAKLTIDELKRLLAGDIGGVCFPRSDLKSADDRQMVEKVNSRWTGVKRKHLEACAHRAFNADLVTGVPGVVIVAVGAYKARFIFEAVRLGLINHLIIDEGLEEALEGLVETNQEVSRPSR